MEPPIVPVVEPRARWRLVVSRTAAVADRTQRDIETEWCARLDASELPFARSGGGRPRVTFGAPLPVGAAATGELLDVVLTERWPRWRVRASIEAVLPEGWALIGLDDTWLGAPSLTASVVAADYRITLGGRGAGAAGLGAAVGALLAAGSLPRERTRGAGTVSYDLRPMLIDLDLVAPGPPTVLRARTVIHPSFGSGRPEEVVAALADVLGAPLEVASVTRERLVLADAVR